jgi:hypothetical protein
MVVMPFVVEESELSSHKDFAFFLISLTGYSFIVVSGKPGCPLYLIVHLQVYSLVQELDATATKKSIINTVDKRHFIRMIDFNG